ncbi:MAG TPA: hypothetical protein VMX35_09620 [Acidobacteriota bacterium]|nr:hypothetical protein [Acidobacteriota bacterium]
MIDNEQERFDFDGEQDYTKSYFLKIEALFSALRGRSLLLSPADYQLAKGWFDRGVPLSCVLRGIRNAYFKKLAESEEPDEEVRNLSWCRWAVQREWKEYKTIEIEAARDEEPVSSKQTGEEVVSILDSLVFDLRHAAERSRVSERTEPGEALIAMAAKLAALREFCGRTPDLGELEEQLRDLDEQMMSAAESAIDEETRKKIARSVEQKLKPHRDSMDSETLEATLRSAFRSKLRMTLGLPLLTLYSL